MGLRKPSHVHQPQPPPVITRAQFDQAVREANTLLLLVEAYYRRVWFEHERQKQGIALLFTVEPCWDSMFHPLTVDLSAPEIIGQINLLHAHARDDSTEATELFLPFSKEIITTPPQAA